MRTTVRLDDEIYRGTKARAVRQGRTVGALIEDALRALLDRRPSGDSEFGPLPVFGGSGVIPGVDLMSNVALRDAIDEGLSLDVAR